MPHTVRVTERQDDFRYSERPSDAHLLESVVNRKSNPDSAVTGFKSRLSEDHLSDEVKASTGVRNFSLTVRRWRGISTIGVPKILQWRGFTWWGPGHGVWGRKSPVGPRGKAPVRGLGETKSHEAEAKCEISIIFNVFLYKTWNLMKGMEVDLYSAYRQYNSITKRSDVDHTELPANTPHLPFLRLSIR